MTRTKKRYGEMAETIHANSPADALRIQEMLRHRCQTAGTIAPGDIRLVAGADAAYTKDTMYAAVVVMTFPALDIAERACIARKVSFPYIPGLLSFREGPAVLDAFFLLHSEPDLIFVNGHGYAHPGRFGIASHIGCILDIPSVGVAQRLLTGSVAFPGPAPGSAEPVVDRGEIIGMAVRTVGGAKPVFVSVGHKIELGQAVEMARMATKDHRITEPVWQADQVSRQFRNSTIRQAQSGA